MEQKTHYFGIASHFYNKSSCNGILAYCILCLKSYIGDRPARILRAAFEFLPELSKSVLYIQQSGKEEFISQNKARTMLVQQKVEYGGHKGGFSCVMDRPPDDSMATLPQVKGLPIAGDAVLIFLKREGYYRAPRGRSGPGRSVLA